MADYDPKLSERPWIVVANKMDLAEAKEHLKAFKRRYKKIEIFPVSADRGEGLEELKQRIGDIVAPEPVVGER